jgi:type IX secretion system PorP/SprF family membrane protein
MQIDQKLIDFGKVNPTDPVLYTAINNDLFNKYNPDAAAGIWVYSKDFYLGVSAQQLLGNSVDFYDPNADTLNYPGWKARTNGPGVLVPHYYLTAGYRMFLSEDWTVMPSGVVRKVSSLPIGIDANMKFQYKDLFWFGAHYRFNDGFAGMVGLNVNSTFNIGYSYDLTTSDLNTVSRGSHEIVLGLLLGNRYGDMCPRNNW